MSSHICDFRKENSLSFKFPQDLAKCDKVFYTVSTSDDPIIEQVTNSFSSLMFSHCLFHVLLKLAKVHREHCKVFATDAILATLMTCTRSQYSWDIVVQVTNTVCVII